MRNALTDVLTDTRIERKYMALHAIYNLTHRHKVNQRLFGTNALRDALINLLVNGSQLEKIWVVRSFDPLQQKLNQEKMAEMVRRHRKLIPLR